MYLLHTRLRSWEEFNELFATNDEAIESVRTFCHTLEEGMDDDDGDDEGRRIDDYNEDELLELISDHGHEASIEEIAMPPQLTSVLTRALPMLQQLGDYIGNGPIDPERPDSLGARCDLIGDIHTLIEGAAPPVPTSEKIAAAVYELMNGRTWSPDTLDAIAAVYQEHGRPFAEPRD